MLLLYSGLAQARPELKQQTQKIISSTTLLILTKLYNVELLESVERDNLVSNYDRSMYISMWKIASWQIMDVSILRIGQYQEIGSIPWTDSEIIKVMRKRYYYDDGLRPVHKVTQDLALR